MNQQTDTQKDMEDIKLTSVKSGQDNKTSSITKGILCIISAAFFFALMGAFIRLSGDIPSMQKSFFRNFIAFIIVIVTITKNKEKLEIKKGDMKYLIMRSVFGTVGIICNFYAVDHLVLSDASMLNKLSPFFVIIFSFIILKERFNIIQGMAVVVAFIGALFIIKPTGNMDHIPALIGALGGVGAGAAYSMVRVMGKRKVNGNLIIMFFSAFSCLVCLPFMIINFKPMTVYQFIMLIMTGVAAAGGQFSVTRAYFYAPAKEISVYDYSQIIFSAMLGFILFGQIPDVSIVAGYLIIFAVALFMFFYNKKKAEE